MRNLIAFLWKNYFFFLFVALEVVAYFLIINNNFYQRRVIINSTNDMLGNVFEGFDNFSEYLSLSKANRILSEENARFYNMRPESFIKNDTTTFFIDDTLYNRRFKYIAAKVISNSVTRRNNYLKLDKGRNHGLKPDMAVITSDGVVGQIIEVSDNFSSVMSILNNNSRISVKLKNANHVGSLFWDGTDYRMGTLVDIPSHVLISKGDTVVTSGFSHIFPEGKYIGIVEDFNIGTGDSFYSIGVKFSVDYNKIYYVYAVENLLRDELLQLDENKIAE
ncbi:MAG: rod shape-determining protein MreC [Bacteroidales bacterium]|nr:rod shape-determining protein MreC [Bacteroidales bacterium]